MTGIRTKTVILTDAQGAERALRFSINAMAEHVDRFGCGVLDDLTDTQDAGLAVRALRRLMLTALCGGGGKATIEDAGDLIEAVGMRAAGEAITEAITAAFPQADASGDAASAAGNGKPKAAARAA